MNFELLTQPHVHFSELLETINESVQVVPDSMVLSKKVNSSLDDVRGET